MTWEPGEQREPGPSPEGPSSGPPSVPPAEPRHDLEPGVAGPAAPTPAPAEPQGSAPPDAPPPPRRKPDPWAHRRGEPRVFAFLWTLFLFAATAATFLAALSTGQATPDVMRPATRALFAIVAAGVAILWPMVRLSQLPDRHPITGCVQDLVVMLVPAQAVIWPQWLGWLGRWSLEVVGAISVMLIAWGFLAGGVLAFAQAGRWRRAARGGRPWGGWDGAGWMLVFVIAGLGGMLATLGPEPSAAGATVRGSWMLSPITAVFELTRDRSWTGTSAAIRPGHWWAIAAAGALGVPAWIGAWLRVRGMKAPTGLH